MWQVHTVRHTFSSDDALNLGPGSRPGSSVEWETRVRAAVRDLLLRHFPAGLTEFDRVGLRIDAADGPDVATLDVDLTGVQVRAAKPGTKGPSRTVTAVETEQGRLRQVHLRAMPLQVEAVPVTVDLEAQNLPVLWARDTEQNLWACGDEHQDLADVRGEARVSAPVAALSDQMRELASSELAGGGFTVSAFDLVLTSTGSRDLDVVAHVKVRKGILSASVDVTGRVEVDEQMVLIVSQVQLASRNPLLAIPLAMLRNRIAAVTGRRVDLNAALPPGVRLVDLRLHADQDVSIWARLD